jgi:hypothetical protein
LNMKLGFVTPRKKILKASNCYFRVLTPGDLRIWFAKLRGSSLFNRDGVQNVVTRVEMCHETGSVLLNLHRRGKPHLSYSVTEFSTECWREYLELRGKYTEIVEITYWGGSWFALFSQYYEWWQWITRYARHVTRCREGLIVQLCLLRRR